MRDVTLRLSPKQVHAIAKFICGEGIPPIPTVIVCSGRR